MNECSYVKTRNVIKWYQTKMIYAPGAESAKNGGPKSAPKLVDLGGPKVMTSLLHVR